MGNGKLQQQQQQQKEDGFDNIFQKPVWFYNIYLEAILQTVISTNIYSYNWDHLTLIVLIAIDVIFWLQCTTASQLGTVKIVIRKCIVKHCFHSNLLQISGFEADNQHTATMDMRPNFPLLQKYKTH